jgi:hypothetical protein
MAINPTRLFIQWRGDPALDPHRERVATVHRTAYPAYITLETTQNLAEHGFTAFGCVGLLIVITMFAGICLGEKTRKETGK